MVDQLTIYTDMQLLSVEDCIDEMYIGLNLTFLEPSMNWAISYHAPNRSQVCRKPNTRSNA